jgi:hypothetical protein
MQTPSEFLESRPVEQQPLVTEAMVMTSTDQAAVYYFKTHLKEYEKMRKEEGKR